MAAPHNELGRRPYSNQSPLILFSKRLAVSSTSSCLLPNSSAEQNLRINTEGSIRGKSLCRKRTSFKKQAPKVYRLIYIRGLHGEYLQNQSIDGVYFFLG